MKLWASTPRTTSPLKFSNITAIGPGQVRAYRSYIQDQRTVLTLDPTKLVQVKQPAIDISANKTSTIFLPRGRSTVNFTQIQDSGRRVQVPFPNGTRGFLYYHNPANRPCISGQLRFRITPNDDPASFSCGYDLHIPHTSRRLAKPWDVPLLNLAGAQRYHGLVSHLVSEGLVEETLLQSIRRLSSALSFSFGGNFLFTLSDPFEVHYPHATYIAFRAVTESGQGRFVFVPPHVNPQNRSRMNFKSGIIRLRFERSTLPEHDGRRVVVARCLEIVEPLVIKSPKRGVAMDPLDVATYTPVPGQLLQTLSVGCHIAYNRPQIWCLDISDDSEHLSAPALRLLW